ncbi:MAG: sulfur transferase domain-containing protein [Acidobacteriota bacterium]|jgi:uncharacterized protein (TIGR01244 family)
MRSAFWRLPGRAAALGAVGLAWIACAPQVRTDGVPVAIPNARMVQDGLLVGGQPTEKQIRRLAREGYRTIVNLRGPGEEGGWDEAPLSTELGMAFVDVPIASRADLNEANARRLAELVDRRDGFPMLVHCASGNRVGALFALKAFYVDGDPPEEALREGLEAGLTRLEPYVREALGLTGTE